MRLFNWRLIQAMRSKIRDQEEDLRCLKYQITLLKEMTHDGGEWGRFFKVELQRVQKSLAELDAGIHRLTLGQKGTEERIMATIQDLKDALAEQNQAILDEIDDINKAMDDLKMNPSHLAEVVTGIKANTETIKGIIADPLPEPEPLPEPQPEPPIVQ